MSNSIARPQESDSVATPFDEGSPAGVNIGVAGAEVRGNKVNDRRKTLLDFQERSRSLNLPSELLPRKEGTIPIDRFGIVRLCCDKDNDEGYRLHIDFLEPIVGLCRSAGPEELVRLVQLAKDADDLLGHFIVEKGKIIGLRK